ncbi:MAG: DUF333 domain-containing protein [Candidatus Micrarchaeota archaeon]
MKLAIVALLGMLLFAGCIQPPVNQDNGTGIANPASVFCAEHNGTLEIRTDASEAQYGVCSFANGATCEEWAYFRGECSPERPNYCEKDYDCACGVQKTTQDCFYGSKDFVDVTKQCPDFCTGIANHLEIKCIKNQCTQMRKPIQDTSNCSNLSVDSCSSECVVCPPCAECSSIGCHSKAFCESIGFNDTWYSSMNSCDATKPCPTGQECYAFPNETAPRCFTGDPCSVCPSGKCLQLESYPPQVRCTD